MKSTPDFEIPTTANYVQQGSGVPVILIHGIAASLHDWDEFTPELTRHGYASYALDLLGHGDSPKPDSRAYHVEWLFEHFSKWMTALQLTEPAVLVGHSLGGYLALEYARRVPAWTRGLILVSPFYDRVQLPLLLRRSYSRMGLRNLIVSRTPHWLFRLIVDVTSVAMGHSSGALHALPEHIRKQTALDYARTAPGVYHIPNEIPNNDAFLSSITIPTLVVWGDQDKTLAPTSFPKLVEKMPRSIGKSIHAGHVPHQSNVDEFNRMALEFLQKLP